MERHQDLWKRPFIGLFLCLVTAGLLFRCASGGKTVSTVPKVHRVDPADYPDAGAVILSDWGACALYRGRWRQQSVLKRRMAIQILNERGYDYANVVIPYSPGSRIHHVKAQTFLPNGRLLSVDPSLFFDTEMPTESMLHARQRALRFTLPGVQPGAVIVYEWQITSEGGDLWPIWTLQRDAPVLHSEYRVDLPRGEAPQWRLSTKIRPVHVETEAHGDRTAYTWTAHQLPPIRQETAAPPGFASRQALRFSPLWAKDWNDVARWVALQAPEAMTPGPETRQVAQNLLDGTKPPLDKLRRLFSHVKTRIRYIAMETTQSGFAPRPADEVLINGYGDCKDMVTALCALGRNQGLDVRPALVSTWPHGRLDSTLVTPFQFNHVIAVAYLPDGTPLWMDPTEKQASFGQLPWYDQDRLALEIHPESQNGRLIRTPAYPPEHHLSDRHWVIRVDESGQAEGTATFFFYGAPALEMRRKLAMLPPSERKEWILHEAFGRFPLAVDPEIHIENREDPRLPLILSTDFVTSHLLLKTQDLYTFFPEVLSPFDIHRQFLSRQRTNDIEMKIPLRHSDHITLHLPAAWRLVSETQGDTLQTAFGSHQWQLEWLDTQKIRIDRFFELRQTRVNRDDYAAFRTFLQRVALADQTLLLFTPAS